MPGLTFDHERDHMRRMIAAAPLRGFAVPHLVIDNVFPDDLLTRINRNWPGPNSFRPEVTGNHIFQMYQRDYGRIAEPQQKFWRAFNEMLWPSVIAATAEALSAPALEVFGSLYRKHLSLDWPLTLMQADPTYPGHGMHTHFYHCPHWTFTMLLYVDPDDTYSRGTALNQVLPRNRSNRSESSYSPDDLDWLIDVAMHNVPWEGADHPDGVFREQVSDYKANRLFVFLDGPLALHSVPFDNPDHTPSPGRALNGGRNARRRIMRSHVKVDHMPFYAHHSQFLPEPLDPERYMRTLAHGATLSADDQRYRETVLRSFYRERLKAYARAAEVTRVQSLTPPQRSSHLWERLVGRMHQGRLTARLVQHVP